MASSPREAVNTILDKIQKKNNNAGLGHDSLPDTT
jgi:hypothetical protein